MASTELAPATSLDFAHQDLAGEIEKAKVVLASAADAGDVGVIYERAQVVAAAARQLRDQRELYAAAGEVRLRAERRAGEIRAGLPRTRNRPELVEFDSMILGGGYKKHVGNLWERLARIPDYDFEGIVAAESGRPDPSFSLGSILGRYYKTSLDRVSRGLYRRADGRYVCVVKRAGISRTKTLNTTDLSEARAALVRMRGISGAPPKASKRLAGAHEYAEKLCAALSAYADSLPNGSPANKLANGAYRDALEAKDKILQLVAEA